MRPVREALAHVVVATMLVSCGTPIKQSSSSAAVGYIGADLGSISYGDDKERSVSLDPHQFSFVGAVGDQVYVDIQEFARTVYEHIHFWINDPSGTTVYEGFHSGQSPLLTLKQSGTWYIGFQVNAEGRLAPPFDVDVRLSGCHPAGCAAQGKNCNTIKDSCGYMYNCGTCPANETCGGGGTPNVCANTGCIPKTCAAQHKDCGVIDDGCGGKVECGNCGSPTYACNSATNRCEKTGQCAMEGQYCQVPSDCCSVSNCKFNACTNLVSSGGGGGGSCTFDVDCGPTGFCINGNCDWSSCVPSGQTSNGAPCCNRNPPDDLDQC
jgi:hypothetical protein